NIVSFSGPPGTPVYNWDWDGTPGDDDFGGPPAIDDDDEDITGIAPDVYYLTLTITDDPMFPSYSCSILDTFVINEPAELLVTVANDSLLCFGDTGTLTAVTTGGTPPYSFDWTHINAPPEPQTITGLGPGNYVVIVTDANGCTALANGSVYEPPALLINVTTDPLVCYGDATSDIDLWVIDGTPPYVIDWDNLPGNDDPEDQAGMPAGTYTVTVTDGNGCTKVEVVVIDQPPFLMATIDTAFCAGESVVIFGVTYTTPGTYPDTIPGMAGACDTAYTINITENPLNTLMVMADLCPGDTVTFYGVDYTTGGVFIDTLPGAALACDTVVTVTINALSYNT